MNKKNDNLTANELPELLQKCLKARLLLAEYIPSIKKRLELTKNNCPKGTQNVKRTSR